MATSLAPYKKNELQEWKYALNFSISDVLKIGTMTNNSQAIQY